MRRVLLTGMSGSGKSTLTAALAERGYKAVDLDSEAWSHWVDANVDAIPGTPVEADRDWVWQDDRVGELLTSEDADILVVSGCSPNQGQFYALLDAVVLLSAPEHVVIKRLSARSGNDYGKGPGEAERVLDLIREVEPILRKGATREIDTSSAFPEVLEAVLRIVDPPLDDVALSARSHYGCGATIEISAVTLIDTRTPNPKSFIKGATGDWEIVIGMEVHAQVTSESKLFSGSSTQFGSPPNSNVSFVDAAMPGMLPVINDECVRQAVRTGLGLKAQINKRSIFDRKNYFYPDLPQGYQISQFKDPIVGEGSVFLDMPEGRIEIGIERLHLEQDAGKSIHDQHPNMSFVDLNRSGVALMEIVSKPDLRNSEEAKTYLGKLRTILRYLGTCDGNMEEGSMRADINVSVRKPGGEFGTRCEIKNVNSIRFAGQAIEFEARRQIDILEDGGKIDQETRLYDPKTGETRSMRSKEEAHDYRYFPDPDLLPLEFDQAFIDELAQHLPELPDDKQARFISEYGVTPYDAMVLTLERATADYYEEAVKFGSKGRDGKAVANLVTGDIAAYANSQGLSAFETHIKPGQIAGIVDLVAAGTISSKGAKDLLQVIIAEEPEGEPAEIVERRGMKQVTDLGAIEKVVDDIIAANPGQVTAVKAKPTMLGWFVGQAMKASGGKANPQALNEILKRKLGI